MKPALPDQRAHDAFSPWSITAGFLILALSDLGFGFTRAGPAVDGAWDHAVLIASILVHCALGGLILEAVVRLLKRVDGPTPPGRWRISRAVTALAIMAAFIMVNRSTFDGPAIAKSRWHDPLEWGFRISGIAAIGLAVFAIIPWLLARTSRSVSAATVVGLAALGIALGCQAANAYVLVGQYPMMHTQLVALAALASCLFAAVGLQRFPRLGRLAGLTAAAFLAVGIAAGFSDAALRTGAAAMVRGPASAELGVWTNQILAPLRPTRQADSTAPISTEVFADGSTAAVQSALDAALPARRGMNVLWVAIDTVRADRVSFNGYARKTTPNLDKLAKDAFVFTHAYSSYPTSNYSYASMLTGRVPRATPLYARLNGGAPLDSPQLTLPGLLTAHGWHTVGVTAFDKATAHNPDWFGLLKTGFTTYNPDQPEAAAVAAEITASSLKVLREKPPGPFFLWMHYMDPHAPYEICPEFGFGTSISDAYDSEIAKCDAEVGRVLDHLTQTGAAANTIVVVFSDHGEEFEEHNGKFHNTSVYDEQVHIPLLIAVPGLKGRKIDTPVSLTDVLPTTVSLLGLKDAEVRHGRDLAPLMLSAATENKRGAYVEFFGMRAGHRERDLRAVISGSNKLIFHVQRDLYEHYDLQADPGENANLIGRGANAEAELRGLLAAWDARIDAGKSAVSAPPAHALRDELRGDLTALVAADAKAAEKLLINIQKRIFDYTRELTPEAATELGPAGVEAFAAEVVAQWTASPKGSVAAGNLAKLAVELAAPSTAPFLMERLREGGGGAFRAAGALARLGNAVGQPLLQQLLKDEVPLDRRQVAAALAHLGDPLAMTWAEGIITCGNWQHVCALIEAFPRAQFPKLGYFLREYITQGLLRPVPVQAKLAIHLASLAGDPEIRWLLLRFAHDGDPIIRIPARKALQSVGVSASEIQAVAEPIAMELDADLAIVNRMYEHAFTRYAGVLASITGPAAGLRLRYARQLHARDRAEDARKVLAPLLDSGVDALDRDLAARRTAMLAAPARFKDAAAFRAAVPSATIPSAVFAGVPFTCTITVRNEGTVPWQGGYWQFANVLKLHWEDASGKKLATREQALAYLPAAGVMPGESATVVMMLHAPSTPVAAATPVLTFTQLESALPPETVIHRAAPVRIVALNAKLDPK